MAVSISGSGPLTGVTSIASAANNTAVSLTDLAGASATCRAWVTFDGATGTISASFNVGSVTRNSQGNYTVNFTTAMVDANYAISWSFGNAAVTTAYAPQVLSGGQTTTSSVLAAYAFDPVRCSAAYFR